MSSMAKVEPEERLSKGPAQQAKDDLRKQLAKKRTLWRTFVFVFLLLLLYGIWTLAILPNYWISVTKRYDSAGTLEVTVKACDVDFVQSSQPTITYGALFMGYTARWTNDASDGSVVRSAVLSNSAGCSLMPRMQCRRMCLVTIGVVAGAGTSFQLNQLDGDESWPLATVTPGTTVETLNLGAWWRPQATLSLFVDTATISGALGGRLRRGEVRAHNASIASIHMTIMEDGSFYLLDLDATDMDLDLKYRNGENRLCLGTDRADSEVTLVRDDYAFAQCDIRDVLDGGTSGWSTYNLMRGVYDGDGDTKVTKAEFEKGLGEIECCGGSCPFSSWCAGQAYEVGFFDEGEEGTTLATFAARLLETNRTNWMPWCTTHLALTIDGGATAGTRTLSNLHSEHGEVVVTLKQGGSHEWGAPRVHYDAGAKPPGLQLLEADAKRLMTSYGEKYGDRDSAENGLVVIDVYGGAGYPASRWMYATNPAYLTIDPPHVTFLTAGMLTPPIVRERVRFADNDCGFEALNRSSALVEMAEQLDKALHSSAWDGGALRGQLVLLGDEMTDAWGNVRLYHFPLEGEERYQREWTNPVLTKTLRISVALSATVGGLLGLMATFVLWRFAAHIEQAKHQKSKAAQFVVLSKLFPGDKAQIQKLQQEMLEGEPAPTGNPFLAPYDLINVLVVRPLRQQLVSSIAKFVRERMVVTARPAKAVSGGGDDAGGGDVPATAAAAAAAASPSATADSGDRFVYMRRFCQEYEMFCLENDLQMENSRDAIQRTLIRRFNARAQQIIVRRIYGIRWRQEHDAPGADEAAVAALLAEGDKPPAAVAATAAAAAADPEMARQKAVRKRHAASVRAFIADKCVADPMPGSWLDFETRPGPDGGLKLGFRSELFAWCKAKGRSLPNLNGDEWASWLPKGVKFRDRQRVRQIRGLAWNTGDAPVQLSWKWFFIEGFTVLMHVVAFFMMPLLTIFYALVMQNLWGMLMCPVGGIRSGDELLQPLLWTDVVRPGGWADSTDDKYTLLLVRIVVWENIAFLLLTTVRLMMHYAGTPRHGPWKAIKLVYSVVLAIKIGLFCAYVGIIGCWFVLAAVLDPSKFLPFGTAVIVIAVVGLTVSREMLYAAEKFKTALWAAFQKGLQLKLRIAMEKIEMELFEKLQAEAQTLASDEELTDEEGRIDVEKPSLVKEGKPITPVDIFMAINTDGAEAISMEQFKRLFELLDLDVTDGQKEQLFAFCDTDMSGFISEKEFSNGWEMLTSVFLESSADSLGLSRAQIFSAVAAVLTTLVLLIMFILLTLTAWQNEGSFNAVVQSVMISGVGKATATLRQRSKAESADNIDGLVGKIMDEQEEAVAENGA